jgi:hypothetical protein
MLGHSSISITLDIYSHLLPDMQEKAEGPGGGTELTASLTLHITARTYRKRQAGKDARAIYGHI